MREEEVCQAPALTQEGTEMYKPSRMEALRYHTINIEFLSIGCIIRVGCKAIPFATVKQGITALNEYVNDPILLTKLWNERFNAEEE